MRPMLKEAANIDASFFMFFVLAIVNMLLIIIPLVNATFLNNSPKNLDKSIGPGGCVMKLIVPVVNNIKSKNESK